MKPGDFRKLTAEARTALAAANEEAIRLEHQDVSAAHVLLGLRAQSGHVAEALSAAGLVSLQGGRDALSHLALEPARTRATHGMAPELLRALDTAAKNRVEVSTSTLCDALLSVDTTATQLLSILGVDPALVSSHLQKEQPDASETATTDSALGDHIQRAVERAELLATRVGRVVDDGDVAVVLLDVPSSTLARALGRLGITRELLEEALADVRPPV